MDEEQQVSEQTETVQETAVQESPEEVVARELRKSPRRGMCAAVLGLEAVVLGLTTPVLITVTDVSVPLALGVGLGLCVLAILTAGMLRKEWGYVVGGAIQVAAVLLGFWITTMLVLGGIFAVLWFGADALGRKIEREKREAWTQWLAEQDALPGTAS